MSTIRLYVAIMIALVVIMFTGLGTANAKGRPSWSLSINGKTHAMTQRATSIRVGAVECKVGAIVTINGVAARTLSCSYGSQDLAPIVQTCSTARTLNIRAGNVTHSVSMECRAPKARQLR